MWRKGCFSLLVVLAATVACSDLAHGGEIVHLVAGEKSITKIQSLGFQHGIRVTTGSLDEMPNDARGLLHPCLQLRGSGRTAGYSAPSRRQLIELRRFVTNGGRAVLFYGTEWTKRNQDLQEVFRVSVSRESVLSARKEVIYPVEGLPTLISSLKVGAVKDSTTYSFGIRAFIAALPEGEKRTVVSSATGKPRLLSTSFPLGRGEVLFMPYIEFSHESYRFNCQFISDPTIDEFQNSEAAVRLIRWLAGQTALKKAGRVSPQVGTKQSDERLLQENLALKAENAELLARIAELRARVARLEAELARARRNPSKKDVASLLRRRPAGTHPDCISATSRPGGVTLSWPSLDDVGYTVYVATRSDWKDKRWFFLGPKERSYHLKGTPGATYYFALSGRSRELEYRVSEVEVTLPRGGTGK